MRRIGILLPAAADDAEFQARVGAFLQALALLGWTIGRNVRIDTRWATTNAAEIRRHAAELAALAPDVILAHGASTVGPLLQATRTVPIVFPVVADPVGAGFVDSLARPGGNATGFIAFEYSMGGKWLELLKQIAPGVTRVAVLRDPANPPATGQFGVIQAVAPSLRVEVNPVNMRDAGEIERAVAAFARSPNGGLIVTASGLAALHRDLIVTLAARHKLPAVYFERFFVAAGGLISYGPDSDRPVPARGRLRRSHPQGREAGRPAGAGADQVRAGHQPQDRQGARPRRAADAARPRRRGDRMKRREFITLLGGAAAAWPLAARAQQPDRMRRIGVLMAYAESDPEAQARVAAFREGLQKLGWTEGRNIRIDTRWAAADAEAMQRFAKELVALQPDLILSPTTPTTAALLQQTRTIPIIFANVADPVGSGFVASFPRPGGNVTGFTILEPTMAGKWLELLKEIAPRVNRVAFLFNPATAPYAEYYLNPFKAAAASFGVEAIVAPVRDTSELESVVAAQAREPNGGLIVMPDSFLVTHRAEITSLAARYRLPAVYPFRYFTELGGLLSYGSDLTDNYRRAATYADRILKGAKPSELPVQAPVKFELVINLKTAKALGLDVPPSLLARADEVIE